MSAGYGSLITMGIGAVSDAYSAYKQGQIAQIGYKLQEDTLRNNLTVAGWNADDARERGRLMQSQQRRKTKQLAGTQRAIMAASGVDLTQGSPLRILTDTAYMGARDEYQIGVNASNEALAYRMQAAGLSSQAAMAQANASAMDPGGRAAGSLLSGATQVAERWYQMQGSKS